MDAAAGSLGWFGGTAGCPCSAMPGRTHQRIFQLLLHWRHVVLVLQGPGRLVVVDVVQDADGLGHGYAACTAGRGSCEVHRLVPRDSCCIRC